MFQSLEIFQLAQNMAVHAGKRQALIAQNVANADTPDYVARDVVSFSDTLRPDPSGTQRATRDKHLNGTPRESIAPTIEVDGPASINGNSVSIETEMLKAVETKRQHDRALAIYKSALNVLHKVAER